MKRSVLIRKFTDHLIFRNYSIRTIESYGRSIKAFFDYCSKRSNEECTVSQYAKEFLTYLFSQGRSWSTVNIHYSAIRLLFVHVLQLEWDYNLLPRPKGRPSLPSVLSGRQVESMINHVKNLKHKCILLLFYSSGIRISELIHLDVSHLLIDRAQLRIVKGKGNKDRIVELPGVTMKLLEYYLKRYNPKPMLFEGHPRTQRYSSSSVRKIIQRAGSRAGILFVPTAHSFRYAYATHHLELGTNLVTLQYQLGHSSARTTLKYVKLCKVQSRKMKHPADLLKLDLPIKTI